MPAPDGPTMATVLPGRHLEGDALQDRPRGIVGEVHVLEADGGGAHVERVGARLVLDLGIALQHVEHGFDVDDRLLDLAIDHAHEVQRLVELDHHAR